MPSAPIARDRASGVVRANCPCSGYSLAAPSCKSARGHRCRSRPNDHFAPVHHSAVWCNVVRAPRAHDGCLVAVQPSMLEVYFAVCTRLKISISAAPHDHFTSRSPTAVLELLRLRAPWSVVESCKDPPTQLPRVPTIHAGSRVGVRRVVYGRLCRGRARCGTCGVGPDCAQYLRGIQNGAGLRASTQHDNSSPSVQMHMGERSVCAPWAFGGWSYW